MNRSSNMRWLFPLFLLTSCLDSREPDAHVIGRIKLLEEKSENKISDLEADVSSLIFALDKLGFIEFVNYETAGRRFYPIQDKRCEDFALAERVKNLENVLDRMKRE